LPISHGIRVKLSPGIKQEDPSSHGGKIMEEEALWDLKVFLTFSVVRSWGVKEEPL
jgi:hypothetical protein